MWIKTTIFRFFLLNFKIYIQYMKDFIKQRLREELSFNIVESLLDEDYPSNLCGYN